MKNAASARALLLVNAYWGGLSYMWNALHPVMLPAMLAALVPPERKNTYLGLLTFAGLLIAMVLQPLSGKLSDGWVSPLGRRRPLMILGTLLDFVFLSILGWAGGLTWIFIGYVGLQISSNMAQGPLQGLMRDRIPAQQLGTASSIKVFLDLMSLVAASAISGRFASRGHSGMTLSIVVIMGLLLCASILTIVFSREDPSRPQPPSTAQGAHEGGRLAAGARTGYWWLIAQRAAFLLGVYGLQAFGQYYLQDALGVHDPARQAGNLLAVIGGGTVLFVLAGGWLSDRVGAKRVLLTASGLAGLGMILMLLTRDLQSLYGAGSLIGAGMGLFLTSNWALANRLAPLEQAGEHLGLTNIATAGAAAMARLEGPVVDWLNALQPGAWLGYRGIFIFGATCFGLSAWFLRKVK